MLAYKALVRPLLFRFDAEFVHDLVSRTLPFLPPMAPAPSSTLASTVAGLAFPTPVGLAAGFDKDARRFRHMYRQGFGSVEVGTLTPLRQDGNPRPRIFRVAKDEAIINRMGFPNMGLSEALPRLGGFIRRPGPLGVNIGANKDSANKIDDYLIGYNTVAEFADYVTINISSPNTPGLRDLEHGDYLLQLLSKLMPAIEKNATPIFIKVSPDLNEQQIDSNCEMFLHSNIAGIIVGNTTTSRPHHTNESTEYAEPGGLSGAPLKNRSLAALDRFLMNLQGKIPVISVGGISSADDVYDRIRRGASLVQLYTSYVYEGPSLIGQINTELDRMLVRDGFSSLREAVGSNSISIQHKLTSFTDTSKPSLRKEIFAAA